jgi:hypothetical protein
MYADQIIERSRDMWAMQEHMPKADIRAALLDITIDVAKRVADRYCKVADQQNVVSQVRGGKVLRDMRTLWRATIKNVKAVYDSHPIHEKHLYVILAAYYQGHARAYPKLLSHGLTGQQEFKLLACYGHEAAWTVKQVLGESYGEAGV